MSAASPIPFVDLRPQHEAVGTELRAAIEGVLSASHFVLGPQLQAFEAEFAQACNAAHCVGVGNGLDALVLLLRAHGIGEGDEVIVPSNTFIATWLAVTQVKAHIVAVDPDPLTHNITAATIAPAITERTRCIIPVHLYGQPADMDPIMALAALHGLVVIEDNAQAQGALYKGRPTGGLGHSAATSFYPGKNLGALGDGGAITTNDASVAEAVRRLRNYGSTRKYEHEVLGMNSRLDELQAAVLRVKLRHLPRWNEQRREVAQRYSAALHDAPVTLPCVPDWATPAWHLYVIQTPGRNALHEQLNQQGIQTVVHYPTPPHRQACYASSHGHLNLPVGTALSATVLSLPMFPGLGPQAIDRVADAVKACASATASG